MAGGHANSWARRAAGENLARIAAPLKNTAPAVRSDIPSHWANRARSPISPAGAAAFLLLRGASSVTMKSMIFLLPDAARRDSGEISPPEAQ
jgi:hypothetical protein